MSIPILSEDGTKTATFPIPEHLLAQKINYRAIYYAINAELANRRNGTAMTKDRSLVRGSRAKPWRQKGTGRARAGSRQSPIWVGGGTAFGPKPKDYSHRIPPKQKQAAIRSIILHKVKQGTLYAIETITVSAAKTKEIDQRVKRIVAGVQQKNTPDPQSLLLILEAAHSQTALIKQAGRNIPYLHLNNSNRLNAHALMHTKTILITKKALSELFATIFANKKEQKSA